MSSDRFVFSTSTPENDHGWKPPLGTTMLGFPVEFADLSSPHRCACEKTCGRRATQEDMLCDECRATCGLGASTE